MGTIRRCVYKFVLTSLGITFIIKLKEYLHRRKIVYIYIWKNIRKIILLYYSSPREESKINVTRDGEIESCPFDGGGGEKWRDNERTRRRET